MNQPELFPDSPSESRNKRLQFPLFPGRFLRLRVAYEDLIFCALGLVLVLLAGFCLGVERGRALTRVPESSEPTEQQQTAGVAVAASAVGRPVPDMPVREERPVPVVPAAVSPLPSEPTRADVPKGVFVIQLASYVGSQSAEEEARRLNRQGVRTQVIKKGKYVELRAVGYRSWTEAKQSLAMLRKTYPDAFLKRLSPQG